jgi:hypothetical protein
MTLAKIGKSELHSARLVYLAARMKSDGEGWVDKEVNKAFAKEQELMQVGIKRFRSLIPVNLDGCIFKREWQLGKRGEILSRLAADFTGWENDNGKFEEQVEKVVKVLLADAGATAAGGAAPW